MVYGAEFSVASDKAEPGRGLDSCLRWVRGAVGRHGARVRVVLMTGLAVTGESGLGDWPGTPLGAWLVF